MKQTYLAKTLAYSFLPLMLVCTTHAVAGGGDACYSSLALNISSYNQCSNLPVLVPSNDNKVNALLLLNELGLARLGSVSANEALWDAEYGTVPFEVDRFLPRATNKIPNQRKPQTINTDFDERCSSMTSGQQRFNQQVKANAKIPAAEKQILQTARDQLNQCNQKLSFITVDPTWTQTTQQYASYLNGSIAFYNANFSTATEIYSALSAAQDPWIKETARYMLIRSGLNDAYATGTGEYGDVNLNDMDQNAINRSAEYINDYLKLYPNGEYAASARGFMRRAAWLSGRQDLLINEIVWQMQNPKSKLYNLDMQQLPAEIDRRIFQSEKFDANLLKDPLLLATWDLMQMRQDRYGLNDHNATDLTWANLMAQQKWFKAQPELFKYLQATHLMLVQNKAAAALEYLPKQSPDLNQSLGLSQAFLKGQILEKTAPQQAEHYWTALLAQAKNDNQRGLFETALFKHLNQRQDYAAYIGRSAKISQANLQREFITQFANENSLQKILESSQSTADQQRAASYTLLSKALIHQNYSLFNQSLKYLPKDAAQYKSYDSPTTALKQQPPFANFIWNGSTITDQLRCPNLQTLTGQLEKSAQDPLLQVCLGEYMRSDQAYDLLRTTQQEQETPSFSGPIYTRGQAYKNVIKQSGKSDLHAYALYRSVRCYAPSALNDCQDQEVPKSTRKQWFDQLKRDYPHMGWTKSLKYYW